MKAGCEEGPEPALVWAVTVMWYRTELSSRPGTVTDCEARWEEGGRGRVRERTSSPVEFTTTYTQRRVTQHNTCGF